MLGDYTGPAAAVARCRVPISDQSSVVMAARVVDGWRLEGRVWCWGGKTQAEGLCGLGASWAAVRGQRDLGERRGQRGRWNSACVGASG